MIIILQLMLKHLLISSIQTDKCKIFNHSKNVFLPPFIFD